VDLVKEALKEAGITPMELSCIAYTKVCHRPLGCGTVSFLGRGRLGEFLEGTAPQPRGRPRTMYNWGS
jgi:hypothetical protein